MSLVIIDTPIPLKPEQRTMLQLVADENFNNNIVRGVLRQKADVDIVRIQDVGLSQADDPTILEWAAQQDRVLLTHDVSTITKYAYKRIEAGQAMPGVFEVKRTGSSSQKKIDGESNL